jgi:hypothetical protein
VPDTHDQANWYKIVVMDHVTDAKTDAFIKAFEAELLAAGV